MRKNQWWLSMNRTNSEYALPSKAAEVRRTPRRYRVGDSRAHFRQVLECAGPAALWIDQTGSWSQCMRRSERGLSMNQPTPAHPRGEQAFIRVLSFPSWEGLGVGSGSQCTASKFWGFSTSRIAVTPKLPPDTSSLIRVQI